MSSSDILLSLPSDLARTLLSSWLDMKGIGRLDTAFCSTVFKSTMLQNMEIISPGMFNTDEMIFLWLDWVVSNRIQLFYRLEHPCLPTEPNIDLVVTMLGRVSLLLYSHDVKLMSIACWTLLYVNTTPLFVTVAQPRYYRTIRNLLTHPHRSLQALAIRNGKM